MNIYETETRTFVMVEKLVKVWEKSVQIGRASCRERV